MPMSFAKANPLFLRAPRPLLRASLRRGRRAFHRGLVNCVPLKRLLQVHYWWSTGVWPDLDRPKDFSEKLTADKLRQPSPLEIQCADKIAVRAYVARAYGPDILIPLVLTTRNVREISPQTISEENFVIKTNHDSGTVFVCKDRENFDWELARFSLTDKMSLNYYYHSFEPQYKQISPAIIVEKYIEDIEAGEVADYKIFCFAGEPKLFQVDFGRFSQHTRLFVDTAWRRLPLRRARYGVPEATEAVPPPPTLTKMLDCARALAKPFPFCRVDLYSTDTRIWFGELTFRPWAGAARYEPAEWERRLGDWLTSNRGDAPEESNLDEARVHEEPTDAVGNVPGGPA